MDIGESSNIAQIGLSYTYNPFGKGYEDYVGILAVLAQCAIDNCKRKFDVDIHSEIQRIKKEMDVASIGYPAFFAGVNPEKRSKVNPNIKCPMNVVYGLKSKNVNKREVIPIKEFFVKHQNKESKYISRKVETFISEFIHDLNIFEMNRNTSIEDYLLLRSDYDELIANLKRITLSDKYIGLMSWLIDRAFTITPDVTRNQKLNTKLNKNRSILLKVLYDLNPKSFKKCFK